MLRVHFLNVGHGDCTIIEHPSGRLTMVDVNNCQEYDSGSFQEYAQERRRRAPIGSLLTQAVGTPFAPARGTLLTPSFDSFVTTLLENEAFKKDAAKELTDPIAFMQSTYPGRTLWRFILTHPDLDHMRGLKRLSETVRFGCVWDTAHTKAVPTFQSDADKEEWSSYQQVRRGPLARTYHRGSDYFAFARDERGAPGGDRIEILSPTPALVAHCNAACVSNDLSYVIRVWHAGKSLLLTGDIESVAWDDLVRTYGGNLKSTFLVASHHGRESGYHEEASRLISPDVVVVSVGRKPSTDASGKYCGRCEHVFSTRYYGNLELQIHDDGSVNWYAQRNAA
jgi:competence protein ComEC